MNIWKLIKQKLNVNYRFIFMLYRSNDAVFHIFITTF